MLFLTNIIGILSFIILYVCRFIDHHAKIVNYPKLANILRLISIILAFAFCILVLYLGTDTFICIIIELLYVAAFSSGYAAW